MKVKKRNLIEMLLQGLFLIFTVIPGFILFQEWYDDYEYLPALNRYVSVKTLGYESLDSLLTTIFNQDFFTMLLGIIFCISIVGTMILFVLQWIGKDKKRNWILPLYGAAFEGVFFVMYSLLVGASDYVIGDSEYRISLNFAFFIMLALWIILIVISLWGYIKAQKHGIIEETPKVYNAKIVQGSLSNADELKKYKDLLDSGIITQEEFDVKKKQLLGL